MKARTFIIMTSAIFCLAVPAAQANLDRTLPAKHGVAAHHKVVAKKSHASKPSYIFVPGPSGQASAGADDCATSGNNCTDQQNCDIWGMNCDLVGTSSTNDASPAESAPVASAASNASSTQDASVGTPTNDDNSSLCPSGGTWDYEYQYCA